MLLLWYCNDLELTHHMVSNYWNIYKIGTQCVHVSAFCCCCSLMLSTIFVLLLKVMQTFGSDKNTPPQRPLSCCCAALFVKVAVGLGRGKYGRARGMPGRGKREERPLPYFVRLACQIYGLVDMAESEDDLDDFDCSIKDLSLRGK